MKIIGYEIDKLPQVKKWSCTCHFYVRTSRQFTDEIMSVMSVSKFCFLSLLKAYLLAVRVHHFNKAKAEERTAKGWV